MNTPESILEDMIKAHNKAGRGFIVVSFGTENITIAYGILKPDAATCPEDLYRAVNTYDEDTEFVLLFDLETPYIQIMSRQSMFDLLKLAHGMTPLLRNNQGFLDFVQQFIIDRNTPTDFTDRMSPPRILTIPKSEEVFDSPQFSTMLIELASESYAAEGRGLVLVTFHEKPDGDTAVAASYVKYQDAPDDHRIEVLMGQYNPLAELVVMIAMSEEGEDIQLFRMSFAGLSKAHFKRNARTRKMPDPVVLH